MNTLLTWRSCSLVMCTSSRDKVPSGSSRSSSVSATALGCSCISLDMKSSYPSLRAASRSQLTVMVWGSTSAPVPSVTRNRSRSQLGHLVVLQHEEVPCLAQDGGDVRRQEGGVAVETHQQRGDPPGRHDQVWLGGAHHGQGEGPPNPGQGRAHGVGQSELGVFGGRRLDQVGQHLGVGLRFEAVAGGDQLVGQLHVVLDDPVVDQGELARAVHVGVGVVFGGTAVGGPPGMADAGGRTGRGGLRPLGQVTERPGAVGRPGAPQAVGGVRTDQGDAGRVVAAVLEPAQPLQQHLEHVRRIDGAEVRGSGDSDDAAHRSRG